jgi:pimeloyl-ACP methyl ester carboxylesterase
MRKQLVLAMVAGGTVIGGGGLTCRYCHDLDAARARLATVNRTVISTGFGAVEYAYRGVGEPVLAIHGIFGGCDQGLLSVGELLPGRRVIAPSRFGYLGSGLPDGATPADQADAFATLLDQLAIARADVIAFSAGATSALQLALRHPGRVQHLVVMSGNWPGSRTADHQPQANRLLVRSELPMWALATFAWPVMTQLFGVPKGLPLTAADRRTLTGLVDSIFPVVPRAEGVIFDFFVSNPDVNNYDLDAVMVPTLIVHAMDDPLIAYGSAQRAAGRIPGARLVSVERGGHPLLGQQETVGPELVAFLADHAYRSEIAACARVPMTQEGDCDERVTSGADHEGREPSGARNR